MSESRFNGVVILDAIPDGELNTARRLKEDLEDISCYLAEGFQVRYFRIDTIEALEVVISEILVEVRSIGLRPWLHLEGHGLSDQNGFQLASGTNCSWDQLKDLITPLNIRLGLNLVLVLATCYGGSFARAIRTVDRAPILGLIGPTCEVKIGEIENGFSTFYRTFFESLSLKKAIDALNATAPKNLYYRTTAERFFYEVWASYKAVYCTEQEINKRARRLYREAKLQKLPRTPSVGQLKRLIRSQESMLFEKYRDTYFMFDIYDSNRTRFSVTYKKARA
jgi:hypothetical protein